MKWFTHDCDMHADLKIRHLIEKEGLEGYAIYNLCLELLGKEGKKGRLKVETRWKKGLMKIAEWSDEGRLDNILSTLGELGLICPNSLKYGHLYCKSFMRRADNWTRRQLRSNSVETTEKVPLQYNTLQDITIHYIRLKGWSDVVKNNKKLEGNIYKRNCKPIKELHTALNGDKNKVIECMTKAAEFFNSKGLTWTVETVVKHLPDLLTNRLEKESPAEDVAEIDKRIEEILGKIATKNQIISLMRKTPRKYWNRIKNFLVRRYPEDGQKSYYNAEQEVSK
jgi:hypothetical protein